MGSYKYDYFRGAFIKQTEIEAWKRYCIARVLLGEPFYYYASGNAKVIAYSPEIEFGNTEFVVDIILGKGSYTETSIYNEKEMFALFQDLRPEFEQISGEPE